MRTARMTRALAQEREAAYPAPPLGTVVSGGMQLVRGYAAAGPLDLSSDPPTPEGLPDWARQPGEQPVRRQTGQAEEPSDD